MQASITKAETNCQLIYLWNKIYSKIGIRREQDASNIS